MMSCINIYLVIPNLFRDLRRLGAMLLRHEMLKQVQHDKVKKRHNITLFLLSLLLLPIQGHAADAKSAFVSHHWQVLVQKEKKKKTCYLYSVPVKTTGTFKKRGEPYVFLTATGGDNYEFSASSGYPYKDKSGAVEIRVDQKHFKTITKDNVAWLASKDDDAVIIEAMAKYNQLHVIGTSQANTTSDDTYSLKGFKASFQWMKQHCK